MAATDVAKTLGIIVPVPRRGKRKTRVFTVEHVEVLWEARREKTKLDPEPKFVG